MIFVRGIMGDIKLNPAIKVWGSLALFTAAIIGAGAFQVLEFRLEVRRCQESGGVWVGNPGVGRLVPTGRCMANKEARAL